MKQLLLALLLAGVLMSCKKQEEFNPEELVNVNITVSGAKEDFIYFTIDGESYSVYDKLSFQVKTNTYVEIKASTKTLISYTIETKSFKKTYFINNRETVYQPIY